MSKKDANANHVSTRINKELKREIYETAPKLERRPAFALAKSIELGWPLFLKKYGKQGQRKSEAQPA